MKYERVVLYACSFGMNGAVNPQIQWNTNGSFGDIISSHYKLPFVNRSVPGTNNDIMYYRILDDITAGKITNSDMVIVQWTFINRVHKLDMTSLMSYHIDTDNYAEWYYSTLYDHSMRTTDLATRCIVLSALQPNTYFGFAEGTKYLEMATSPVVYKKLRQECNIVAFNDDTIPNYIAQHAPPHHLHPCLHPTSIGHEFIATHYIDNIGKL